MTPSNEASRPRHSQLQSTVTDLTALIAVGMFLWGCIKLLLLTASILAEAPIKPMQLAYGFGLMMIAIPLWMAYQTLKNAPVTWPPVGSMLARNSLLHTVLTTGKMALAMHTVFTLMLLAFLTLTVITIRLMGLAIDKGFDAAMATSTADKATVALTVFLILLAISQALEYAHNRRSR